MFLNADTGARTTASNGHRTYSFDEFVLDIDRGTLAKNGLDIPLRPKSFAVLSYFVRHSGVLLNKRELLKSVWGEVVVTEDSLTQCLIEIRKALGDDSREKIRTVSCRGYIFDVAVTEHLPETEAETALRSRLPFSRRRPSAWSAGAAVVLTMAIAVNWWNDTRSMPQGQGGAERAMDVASNSPAMQHYLRGKFFHGRRAPRDTGRALEQFQRAVDIDPDLVEAWVGLAGATIVHAYESEDVISEEVLTSYKFSLDRALSLAPDNAEAHARLSTYYCRHLQFDMAQEHLDYALVHGQESPLVLSIAAGSEFSRSRHDEAIDLQRRAAELDPLGYVNRGNLASFLYSAGRLDEALVEFNKALDLNPGARDRINESLLGIHVLRRQFDRAAALALQLPDGLARDRAMALIHEARGEQAEFVLIMERLASDPGIEPAAALAEIYANLVKFDESFHWLTLATERQLTVPDTHQSSDFLADFRNSPFLRPLRGDRRWTAWLEGTESRIADRFSLESSLMALDSAQLKPDMATGLPVR